MARALSVTDPRHPQPGPGITRTTLEQWPKSDLRVSGLLLASCVAQEGIFWYTMTGPLVKVAQMWTWVLLYWALYIWDCWTFSPHSKALNHSCTWKKGCDKRRLTDKTYNLSYLSAQTAIVLDLGSERNFLQLTLTRIRDLICFLPRACNLIFKV